jgi:hypothetical protein
MAKAQAQDQEQSSASSSAFENFGAGSTEGTDEEDGSFSSAEVEYEGGEGMLVDLSGTDENMTYPVQPRGIYDAELMEMDYGQSQRSGNNMWTTIWELLDDRLVNDRGQRPRQYLHLTFTEGGLPRVKRFLARVKVPGEHEGVNLKMLTTRFDPQKVADDGILLGARARLRVDIRRYEGQNRNNVRDILPPSESGGGMSFGNLE